MKKLNAIALALALAMAGLASPEAEAAWDLPPLDKVLNYQPKLPLQVFTAVVMICGYSSAVREKNSPVPPAAVRYSVSTIGMPSA